jgi:hypothetical protein
LIPLSRKGFLIKGFYHPYHEPLAEVANSHSFCVLYIPPSFHFPVILVRQEEEMKVRKYQQDLRQRGLEKVAVRIISIMNRDNISSSFLHNLKILFEIFKFIGFHVLRRYSGLCDCMHSLE